MEFKKYNKIDNANSRTLEYIEMHGFANTPYVVTEKIHGANFGIHYSPETKLIKYSRRNDFLNETENFNGYTTMIKDFRISLEKLGELLPNVKEFRVFGEIFGGGLNGVKDHNAKTVQGQVQYSPKNEFMAFELYLDDEAQSFYTMSEFCRSVGLSVVPVLGLANNIYEALEYCNIGNSVIPELLGYESPITNIKEGNVIVPYYTVHRFSTGSRVILKSKNSLFKESKEIKVRTSPKNLSTIGLVLHDELIASLTDNRLSNVMSKEVIEGMTNKDFGRILGLLVQDVLQEYSNEFGVSPKEVGEGEWTSIAKRVTKEATLLVRSYFVKHIF